ncbi:monovalent cation:H+ antiporter, CPA1 (nhx1) [Brettanomyces nanus]|uniref:Sodium/hydrogen exchanger n=1 Tax=Eeniella nana TaxID=13502 RepID=A0A875S6A8_EENNA|nr:monovalent cation:H+ antiporter, CPA1 (nhx1) [Brettanomyces nanus]QPG76478.1 monovalent cation:H+ antiporter, CPA1 (nhx1) [Brettanomyces nanus]
MSLSSIYSKSRPILLWIFAVVLLADRCVAKEVVNPIDEAPVPEDPEVDLPGADDDTNPISEEIFSSWALFIVLFLLGSALWSSYYLQQKRIKAIHETVLSIFYGMVVGLIIRVSPGHYIQDAVKFNSNYFFNILLPPIILNSGYELHQANFFRNIGSILIFAIPGTFISAIVVGIIMFVYTKLGIDGINISFVDALAVGATLSATDPVTILSIFNSYKVDPKLYTIIFGESLLNDAICIVMFETCERFHGQHAEFSSLFQGVALFLITFTISTLIGLVIGTLIALLLKHSHIRRYPQIESCLVLLLAYESYFFSNGCHMSGIVSLLFCGITLKHYAYYNMSRRTQIATKYVFQLLAQLSENFIFIYLGLSLFTEVELVFKPLLIIVTFACICIARWAAIFPLSRLINWIARSKTSSRGYSNEQSQEIPYNYQMMQFWAGLRGAVGVALAMGLQGDSKYALLATVLVVVVLTVILFGGTTAAMLEILNIKTGCVEEGDETDDEFDIEAPTAATTSLPKRQIYSNHGSATSSRYYDDTPVGDELNATPLNVSVPTPQANNNNPKLAVFPSQQFHFAGSQTNADGRAQTSSGSSSGAPVQSSASMMNLGNMLNLEEQTKWFTSFDENVLKPVLLDNLPDDSDKHTNNASSSSST